MKKLFLNYFVMATFFLMANAVLLACFTFKTGISKNFDENDKQVVLIKQKSEF